MYYLSTLIMLTTEINSGGKIAFHSLWVQSHNPHDTQGTISRVSGFCFITHRQLLKSMHDVSWFLKYLNHDFIT